GRAQRSRWLALALAAPLVLAGCLSVPDALRADFAPPDGKRPNNYGRGRVDADGVWRVHPDRPTVAWREPAGHDAGFLAGSTRRDTEEPVR
ncbi:MAG: hypothetical protein D6776_07125, partial [Planctomycetota bacterium]